MKVLVIDDDARLRDALEIGIQLQWEDSQVLTAADGEVGLGRVFNEEPDIVVFDVNMPRCPDARSARLLRADPLA
jgi:two-component system, OmpR family, alkaline phosphatase synthesis response regulator PhoP